MARRFWLKLWIYGIALDLINSIFEMGDETQEDASAYQTLAESGGGDFEVRVLVCGDEDDWLICVCSQVAPGVSFGIVYQSSLRQASQRGADGRALRTQAIHHTEDDNKMMERLLNPGSTWSESTKEINDDADRLYRLHREQFTAQFGSRPLYPVTAEEVEHFVAWLASADQGQRYKFRSIQNSYVAGVARLHYQHTRSLASSLPNWHRVTAVLAQVRRHHEQTGKAVNNDNAHPITLNDLEVMIKSIPKTDPHRLHDATMCLLAIMSGARAMTLQRLRLEDVSRPTALNADGSRIRVTVYFQFQKGRFAEGFGHSYTGYWKNSPAPERDLVYFLHRYCVWVCVCVCLLVPDQLRQVPGINLPGPSRSGPEPTGRDQVRRGVFVPALERRPVPIPTEHDGDPLWIPVGSVRVPLVQTRVCRDVVVERARDGRKPKQRVGVDRDPGRVVEQLVRELFDVHQGVHPQCDGRRRLCDGSSRRGQPEQPRAQRFSPLQSAPGRGRDAQRRRQMRSAAGRQVLQGRGLFHMY